MKKHDKKNTYSKYKVLAVVFVSLIILGVYAVREVSDMVAERDGQIWRDGYEVGRFDELNESDDYKSMKNVNEYGELEHSTQTSNDKILQKLAQLESQNGKKRKILDTNNRYSLGLYHWQAHSVQDVYKRYYGKKITLSEAVKIAEDDELATKLAYDTIFVKKELFHWKLSMCRMGMITNNCPTQKEINKLVMK